LGPSASGALHRWSCERKCGTHFPCLLPKIYRQRLHGAWGSSLSYLIFTCLLAAAGGWVDHALKRFAGFSEYADRATQSPASTGCVAHCCAARTGSASQTVASQPLASRALVASQLVCFADSVLCASVSASHSSFTVRHCCQSARSTFIVLCRWAVHGYGIRTTPQYSTLECSVLASGISAGFDAALGLTPLLLYCCGPIYCGGRLGPYGEVVQVVRGSS